VKTDKELNAITLMSSEKSNKLNAAIDVLMSGKQSYDCFRHLAEYFSAHIDNPDQIDPQAIKWIALALKRIVSGDSPEQALGIKRKVGRVKNDFSLIMRVAACMELSKREGVKKSQAIQAAADFLHKDPRHIQRILAKRFRADLSNNDTEMLRSLASKGVDVKFLIANDDEFFCW